jgi:predicted Zn-dependent protease
MLARFEENPQRAAFLRDYDLKRLPDDPAVWERAVRSLHEQNDDTRARRALTKLEKLAPEKAAALKKDLSL